MTDYKQYDVRGTWTINDNFLEGLPQSILGGAPRLGWYQKEGPDMLPAELQQNFLIPKVAASGAKSRAVGTVDVAQRPLFWRAEWIEFENILLLKSENVQLAITEVKIAMGCFEK